MTTSFVGFTQSHGILKGQVTDGSTGTSLFGVAIAVDTAAMVATTASDGKYSVRILSGKYSVIFSLAGYQSQLIENTPVGNNERTTLNVILSPISLLPFSARQVSDSVNAADTQFSIPFKYVSRSATQRRASFSSGVLDFLQADYTPGETAIDATQLLKRLNGVVIQQSSNAFNAESAIVFGMGGRYNQLFLNGSPVAAFSAAGELLQKSLIPAMVIESESVQKIANSAIPANVTGGTISVITKDFPDRNFLFVNAGTGYSEDTKGQDFLGAEKTNWQAAGLTDNKNNLPAGFPTTRSRSSFNQKNPQEQVYLSKLLANTLAPHNYGTSKPAESFSIGFGRVKQLRGGGHLGLMASINRQAAQLITPVTVQVAPDVATNQYPFADASNVLIHSLSNEIRYKQSADLTGNLTASLSFGRNKISLKTLLGTGYSSIYSQRTVLSKSDEDTLGRAGIGYLTEQRKFINFQLSGLHALGKDNKFKLNWQATYFYYRQQNPDELNILLRRDSAAIDRFEIAQQSVASLSNNDLNFVNSGRLWRDFTDNNFTASMDIQVPFNLFRHAQLLSGGIYIETKNRIFFSDLLLLQGHGYYPVDQLLSADRYFPGGLTVRNYYTNVKIVPGGNYTLDATNRANYTASANLGAAFIKSDNRFTKDLSLQWGFRLESNSQLVSNTQYNYFEGYRNPQTNTLDENTRVIRFDFLPSLTLNYQLLRKVRLHTSFFQTVNRPEMQELSLTRYYDASSFMVKTGNSGLATSRIANVEAGFDWFANATNSIKIDAYYKKIDQPIENIISAFSTSHALLISVPYNTPSAEIRGINAAINVNLNFIEAVPWLSGISFFGNGNWQVSEVGEGPVKNPAQPVSHEHPLSGSPAYSVNGGIVIRYHRLPGLSVLYNRTGDYVSAVGSGTRYTLSNGKSIFAIPDYRVKGRRQLDVMLSQKLFKERMEITLGVNNFLKDPYISYQDLNGNNRFDTPLILKNNLQGQTGFFQEGIDNTVIYFKTQRNYYVNLSYSF